MTVIVGYNWYSEIGISADSRVSWINRNKPPQDVARKLYVVGNVVIGFCGNINAANKVLRHLLVEKFRNPKRPIILTTLKDDLKRWIDEAIVGFLHDQTEFPQFMLCGIETRRPPFSGNQTGKVSVDHLTNPDVHIYTYTVGEKTRKIVCEQHRDVAIIGSGKEFKRQIIDGVHETIHFGFDQPNAHWARPAIINQVLASTFKGTHLEYAVGGPFHTIRITPQGLTHWFSWYPTFEPSTTFEQLADKSIVVTNPKTNETYTLRPIWNLRV